MPKVALQRAAELTGKTRSTIHRAMQTGRLSYGKSEAGTRLIDVSELDRVFGIKRQVIDALPERNDASASQRYPAQPESQRTELQVELAVARTKISMLESRVHEIRQERDRWATQAERLLADLRPPASEVQADDASTPPPEVIAQTKTHRSWWRWVVVMTVVLGAGFAWWFYGYGAVWPHWPPLWASG